MFLNGRYVRYVHIPEGVDMVQLVHNRHQMQGKAQLSHRRASEVIRESVARRERFRLAQENAVRSVEGHAPIPTEGRRLGAEPDERQRSSALDYTDTTKESAKARTQGASAPASHHATAAEGAADGGEAQGGRARMKAEQEAARAAGFVDKLIERCKDCGFSFTWTAGEQQFYVRTLLFFVALRRLSVVWWCVGVCRTRRGSRTSRCAASRARSSGGPPRAAPETMAPFPRH